MFKLTKRTDDATNATPKRILVRKKAERRGSMCSSQRDQAGSLSLATTAETLLLSALCCRSPIDPLPHRGFPKAAIYLARSILSVQR